MKNGAAVFLILSGAAAALLSSFVFLYFNMIGLEPAFFKTFYTDLVPSAAIVPLALLSLLAGFIVMSLVTGIHSGTFREMNFGFRFHFSDGAALAALIIAYLIYRMKRGRNNGR